MSRREKAKMAEEETYTRLLIGATLATEHRRGGDSDRDASYEHTLHHMMRDLEQSNCRFERMEQTRREKEWEDQFQFYVPRATAPRVIKPTEDKTCVVRDCSDERVEDAFKCAAHIRDLTICALTDCGGKRYKSDVCMKHTPAKKCAMCSADTYKPNWNKCLPCFKKLKNKRT